MTKQEGSSAQIKERLLTFEAEEAKEAFKGAQMTEKKAENVISVAEKAKQEEKLLSKRVLQDKQGAAENHMEEAK